MGSIAIVADSTCDLGPERMHALGVPMVPLKVQIGDKTYLDWIDLRPGQFYPMLVAAQKLPTTSQPTPGEFSAVYQKLADEGATGIVSIHLSAPLSGTFESATMAAKTSPVPVRVIDSKVVSHATRLVLEAAIDARDAGKDLDGIAAVAEKAAKDVQLFFLLDTLDYLVKGGRAGKAQGLAAALLNIKPILWFNDEGTIEPFRKVKGTRKAIQELAAHVAEQSKKLGKLKVIVIHAENPEAAADLAEAIGEAGTDGVIEDVSDIGAVIGTHAGPKALGVAYIPMA